MVMVLAIPSAMKAWIYLIIAGLLEVVWASAMKKTVGFTKLWPSVITIVAMLISFTLLERAMRSLPLSISYTVWVGIGAIGTALVGVFLYKERLTVAQWVCMLAIAGGIVGLKALSSPKPPPVAIAQ
jgi:quaternary ammonium compound-resistance protein SugE